MKTKTRAVLLGLVLALISTTAGAQTIGQTGTSDDVRSTLGQGQSFTATVTGTVTQIAVRPSVSMTADTLRLYNGAVGSGVPGSPGAALYSQTVNTTATTNSGPLQTFVLTTPFPIVAGNNYSFVFATTRLHITTDTNAYSGGGWIYNHGGTIPTYDAAFQVTQQVGAGPTPVPTLSEWAMILLGLILAGGAVAIIQRRRRAA